MVQTVTTPRTLIIIGAGGHAVSVANVAYATGIKVQHFVDPSRGGEWLLGIKIIASLNELPDKISHDYAVAIGHNGSRERVHHELVATHGELSFPALVHPSAILSIHTNVGQGTVIMPNAVVGPCSVIGQFCILNTMSSIDHDCVLSNYASLAPGAITGGNVKLGERAAIGIGAAVKNAITIGQDTVIGGRSYVHDCIENNVVAFGTPAKFVRTRESTDPYLN
jgi:sugar O-acyltransferase (sialic acid O-acetyltransferase NeuD family)